MSSKLKDDKRDELKSKLLEIGGHQVSEFPEPHLSALLLKRGREFEDQVPDLREGDEWLEDQPHRNAALYYMERPWCHIGTGYVLGDNGDWKLHSWLVDEDQIIEPTSSTSASKDVELRTYFGVILSKSEAARFVVWELPNLLPDYVGLAEFLTNKT